MKTRKDICEKCLKEMGVKLEHCNRIGKNGLEIKMNDDDWIVFGFCEDECPYEFERMMAE